MFFKRKLAVRFSNFQILIRNRKSVFNGHSYFICDTIRIINLIKNFPPLKGAHRSTTSQILTIRRILEGVRAKKLQATLLFVDFTEAFDSIHRGKMEEILPAYGQPKETVAAITILYRDTKVKVRSPDGDTEYFHIERYKGQASPIPLYHLSRLRA